MLLITEDFLVKHEELDGDSRIEKFQFKPPSPDACVLISIQNELGSFSSLTMRGRGMMFPASSRALRCVNEHPMAWKYFELLCAEIFQVPRSIQDCANI